MTAYSKLPDDDLITRLKTGDEIAFAEIYTRYSRDLTSFAASKLYNLDNTRDILQDVFAQLWQDRQKLIVTSSLKKYLYTAVRYKIVDHIRRNIVFENYLISLQSLSTICQNSVDKQLEAKEAQEAIDLSLTSLSPRVKEIYKLNRESGLSIRQIADKLCLSEQTVKNQLTIALKHLRSSLGKLGITSFIFWWLLLLI